MNVALEGFKYTFAQEAAWSGMKFASPPEGTSFAKATEQTNMATAPATTVSSCHTPTK